MKSIQEVIGAACVIPHFRSFVTPHFCGLLTVRRLTAMPHFRVLLHGTGILVPLADGEGAPIEGFYTTRAVTATDADAAVRLASDLIRAEWTTGSYASANLGSVPTLAPDEVFEVSFFSRWFKSPKGYTFYKGGDEEEDDDPSGAPPNKSLERTREG